MIPKMKQILGRSLMQLRKSGMKWSWNINCHKDEVIEAEFRKWFVQEKASTMISCMLSDIRQSWNG